MPVPVTVIPGLIVPELLSNTNADVEYVAPLTVAVALLSPPDLGVPL